MGADVVHWDPFISLIILTKLDEETRSEWKQRVGRRTDISVSELLEFLEVKAIDVQPSQGDKLSQLLKGDIGKRHPKRVFQISEGSKETPSKPKKKCIVCQGDHFPWQCEKLKKECAKVRKEIIKSVGACFKCLLKHEIGECKKSNYPYCGVEARTTSYYATKGKIIIEHVMEPNSIRDIGLTKHETNSNYIK